MSVVKLRREDRKIFDDLRLRIKDVKGETNASEVLGLSLRFTQSRLDDFLSTLVKILENDSVMDILKNPVDGERTDARKIEEYLYG